MKVTLELRVPESPRDARRAAFRARDHWRTELHDAGARALEDGGGVPGDAVLEVAEPTAVVVPGGLGGALGLIRSGRAATPGGFFGAASWSAPCVAAWELEAAEPVSAPAAGDASPARLRPTDAGGIVASSVAAWRVLPFRGRKSHGRDELLPLVPRGATRILEVGCGAGAFGAALEEAGARVTGVEPDPEAAAEARGRLSRVLDVTLDQALAALEGERFDVVVLADVLEHVPDPVSALRGLRARLAGAFDVVLSLPNACHAALLAGALQGRWDLALEGVTADDHVTYAGRAGWTSVLAEAGFEAGLLQPLRVATASSRPWIESLSVSGLGREDLEAVQWIGLARSRGESRGPVGPPRPTEGPTPFHHEDPVGACRRALAAGAPLEADVANAVSGSVLDALLAGSVVRGDALALAATRAGLERRFRGSDLRLGVEERATSRPSPRLARVLDAARAARLPVDEAAMAAERLRLRVEPGQKTS